jgi:plasmid maintenance system killer protein
MTIRFNNDYLEALFRGHAVSGKPKYDKVIIVKFKKTVLMLANAENIGEIQKIKGLNFELLIGNYKGYCSVRVDKKYRLILLIEGEDILKAEALIIQDLTNHYK